MAQKPMNASMYRPPKTTATISSSFCVFSLFS